MLKKDGYKFLFGLVLILALLLRILRLDQLPPSLYWEEAAIGYDAYSILKTGKDHHGNFLPITAFESFGDWKPSLYFYSAVPTIAIFGLNEWGVRLPSVLAGMMIVVGVGQLAKFILSSFKNESLKKKPTGLNQKIIRLLAMLITAVSPWAIHFSRAAWESNLATAFILWAVLLGVKFIQGKSFKHLAGATFLLVLATYTYHAARLTAPLLGLGLVVLALKEKRVSFAQTKDRTRLIILGLFSLILVSPLLLKLSSAELSQRAAQTSIFSQIEIIEQSNRLKEQAGNTFLARVFYHRYLLYTKQFLQNFLSHFRLDFLFLEGDTNPRHSVQYFGHLYPLELIGLVLGLMFLAGHFNWVVALLTLWLLAGILPASLTKTTPHALRILNTMPIFLTVVSFGWTELFEIAAKIKNKLWLKLSWVGVIFIYLIQLTAFWHYYNLIYPQKYAQYWQGGYEQVMTTVEALQQQYPNYPVYITRSQGRPAIYYWFYTQTQPQQVQAEEPTVKKDQSEFLEFKQTKFGLGLDQVCHDKCIAAMTKQELEESGLEFEQTSQVYQNRKYSLIVAIK